MLGCADGNEIKNVESLQFDLSSIEDATNHFTADNKLGEGGFGEVYKVSKRCVMYLKFEEPRRSCIRNFANSLFNCFLRAHFPMDKQ